MPMPFETWNTDRQIAWIVDQRIAWITDRRISATSFYDVNGLFFFIYFSNHKSVQNEIFKYIFKLWVKNKVSTRFKTSLRNI